MAKSFTVPYEQVNTPAGQIGGGTARMVRDLANGARSVACNVYQKLPQAVVPNPGNSFLRGFWNEICDPFLPPEPQPPFPGGQCVGARYRVFWTRIIVPTGNYLNPPGTYNDCDGPVRGLGSYEPNNPSAWYGIKYGESGLIQTALNYSLDPSREVYYQKVEITGVQRIDGGADNCGSLPPVYPPPTTPLSQSDLNVSVSIKGELNSTNLNVNMVWNGGDQNNYLQPSVRFGDTVVTFDINGVTFNYNPEINTPNPQLPFPTIPPELIPDFPNPLPFLPSFPSINNQINSNNTAIITAINNSQNTLSLDINNSLETNLTATANLNTLINNLVISLNSLSDRVEDYKPARSVAVTVPNGQCTENGWQPGSATFTVPENLAQWVQGFFTRIDASAKELCEKEVCQVVGVPSTYFEQNTSECAVLYFAYTPPQSKTIGRYVSIPRPNLPLLLAQAQQIPNYKPGRFMSYVQYLSSKGNQLRVFGQTREETLQYRVFLEQFTLFSEEQVYFKGEPRETKPKHSLDLKLRRITHFEERPKGYNYGRDAGNVIWEYKNA